MSDHSLHKGRVNRLTEVLSILGAVASFAVLVLTLIFSLGLSAKLSIAVLAIAAGFLAGTFSMYLARTARKLPRARRVFLSYSHNDSSTADEVVNELRKAGAKVWVDTEQLRPGETITHAIEKAINDADTAVLLLSRTPSPHVLSELRHAQEKEVKVIPVILENLDSRDLPPDIQNLGYIDFRRDKKIGLQKLVETVT
jgi:predicted nucleotide-binding protein